VSIFFRFLLMADGSVLQARPARFLSPLQWAASIMVGYSFALAVLATTGTPHTMLSVRHSSWMASTAQTSRWPSSQRLVHAKSSGITYHSVTLPRALDHQEHAATANIPLAPSSVLLLVGSLITAASLLISSLRQRHVKAEVDWPMISITSAPPPVDQTPSATQTDPITHFFALLRLVVNEFKLRWFKYFNPQSPLYALPARRVITNDADVMVFVDRLPVRYQALFKDWYTMYKEQVMLGGSTETEVFDMFNQIVDRLILLNREPYTFQPAHQAIRAPFDYFEFGQQYTRLLIDFDKSYLRNIQKWDDIAQALLRKENVILLTNHQTEADAAFIPLLLEAYNRRLGEKVIYVAGDRVVSDPMVQPFSMGRNLFCVHSKKHMDDDPRMSREEKQKMNRRTLVEMSKAFKQGGVLVWIAPSGGRDRKNAAGEWAPAPFDQDAVELFRALGAKCGRPTWLYPFVMATHAILPPPDVRITGDLGEKRVTNFSPVALSAGDPFLANGEGWLPEGVDLGSEQAKELLTSSVFKVVNEEYNLIKNVMKGFGDGTYVVPNGSQPWKTGAKSPYPV
jgi:glycerol-3-phosphate O-acyltransferase